MMLSKGIDWIKIRNEYINGNISYRNLAKKHCVSFATLQSRAKKEKWKEKRDKQHDKIDKKIGQKTADNIAQKEIDRQARLLNASDKLIDKLEQATKELDKYFVTNKEKTKLIEYTETGNKKKLDKEVIFEYEKGETLTGVVDRLGIKLLSDALKNIQAVQNFNKTDEGALNKLDELLRGISDATK